MPAFFAAALSVLRLTVWSPLATVRVLVWRGFARVDPFLGFKASLGGWGIRAVVRLGVRRGWWAADNAYARAIVQLTDYDLILHREISRRHLWRQTIAISAFHDVQTLYVHAREAQHRGKEHVEFQSAEGRTSFWAERRRR